MVKKHQSKTKDRVYTFIDSQNLNLGTKKDIFNDKKQIYQGWQLDYQKFRRYLSDKFRVSKAFYLSGSRNKIKKCTNNYSLLVMT